jgi:osmotically-inducible protein OsmY
MRTKYKLVAMSAIVLLLCTGVTGCNKEASPRTEKGEQIDQHLIDEVRAAFDNSPAFKFPDVQVAAFKGTIQLSGFVSSDDQKSSAETITKRVPGVMKVENSISLKQ